MLKSALPRIYRATPSPGNRTRCVLAGKFGKDFQEVPGRCIRGWVTIRPASTGAGTRRMPGAGRHADGQLPSLTRDLSIAGYSDPNFPVTVFLVSWQVPLLLTWFGSHVLLSISPLNRSGVINSGGAARQLSLCALMVHDLCAAEVGFTYVFGGLSQLRLMCFTTRLVSLGTLSTEGRGVVAGSPPPPPRWGRWPEGPEGVHPAPMVHIKRDTLRLKRVPRLAGRRRRMHVLLRTQTSLPTWHHGRPAQPSDAHQRAFPATSLEDTP